MNSLRFAVSKEVEFDAGHRVPDHESKCKNPHGHRYKVKVHVQGPLKTEGSENGMVIDFGHIKNILMSRVHDVYDHGFIVYVHDNQMMSLFYDFSDTSEQTAVHGWKVIPIEVVPTAENLAYLIFEDLVKHIPGLVQVEVYETPTSVASYPTVPANILYVDPDAKPQPSYRSTLVQDC